MADFTTPGTGASGPVAADNTQATGGTFTTPNPTVATPDRGQILDNSGTDDPAGGLKNVATGLLRAPTHIPGLVGEARDLGDLIGSNVASIMPGEARTAKQIRDDFKRNQAFNFDRAMSIHGPETVDTLATKGAELAKAAITKAPTGEDIYNKTVDPLVGHYDPTTTAGRITQAGLESITPGPGGKVGAFDRAATTGQRVLDTGRRVLTSTPGKTGIAGGTAQAVTETTDSPGAGIATALVVPALIGHGRPKLSVEDEASQRLYQGAGKEADTSLDKLHEIGKVGYKGEAGSNLSLAEATGSSNLANVEKGHATANPEFGTDLNTLRGDQSSNRTGVLGTMTQGTDQNRVSDLARAARDHIYSTADANTDAQRQIVESMVPPEKKTGLGQQLVSIADHNNEQARARVSELYNAIDPDGTIHVDAAPLSQAAAKIEAGINPRLHLASPEAEKVVAMAKNLPPTLPFKDLVEFDKTVGGALWRARQSHDAHGAQILKNLQQELEKTRDSAIDIRSDWEQGQVARGELKASNTIAGRLQQQQSVAGAGSVQQAGVTTPVGPGRTSGPGSNVPSGPGVGVSQPIGAAGLQQQSAAERQTAAKAAHAERMGTYEEGPVGDFLTNDRAFTSNVPGSAFAPGPTGEERTRAWLKAGANNPQMLEGIKDTAVTALANMTKDGIVTPDILNRWKTRFGPALAEIEKEDPGFSSRFDAHAAAEQNALAAAKDADIAKKNFGNTELAKFLGYQSAQEVNDHVGRLMGSDMGAMRLRTLMTELQGNPQAQDALRNATVKWLRDQATSRELLTDSTGKTINASAPGNFIEAMNDRRAHLEAVFGPQGYQAAENVAAEMARGKKIVDAKMARGGSDTARNLIQYLNDAGNRAGGSHSLSTAEAFGTWEAIRELSHAATGGGLEALGKAAGIFAAKYGLGKWNEAVARQRGARNEAVAGKIQDSLLDSAYGHELLLRGRDVSKVATPRPFGERALVAGRFAGNVNNQAERQGHARGGSVRPDAERHARRLVRLVDEVREGLGKRTEPLLHASDDAVAQALEAARRAAGGSI